MNDKQTADSSWLNEPADVRLSALLFEMRAPLQNIRGATSVLQSLEVDNIENLPEHFGPMLKILDRSVEQINEAVFVFAGRRLYQSGPEKHPTADDSA